MVCRKSVIVGAVPEEGEPAGIGDDTVEIIAVDHQEAPAVGRFVYRSAYLADPGSRGKGVMIGFLASVAMVMAGLWGVITELL